MELRNFLSYASTSTWDALPPRWDAEPLCLDSKGPSLACRKLIR